MWCVVAQNIVEVLQSLLFREMASSVRSGIIKKSHGTLTAQLHCSFFAVSLCPSPVVPQVHLDFHRMHQQQNKPWEEASPLSSDDCVQNSLTYLYSRLLVCLGLFSLPDPEGTTNCLNSSSQTGFCRLISYPFLWNFLESLHGLDLCFDLLPNRLSNRRLAYGAHLLVCLTSVALMPSPSV